MFFYIIKMKKLLFIGLILVSLPKTYAFTTMAAFPDMINVEWYQRWDTYVNSYYRTSPNNTTVDNRQCYENLTRCYDGLTQEEFSKVNKLYRELDEINEENKTLREDIKNRLPWISSSQLSLLYNQGLKANNIRWNNIIKTLENYKDRARVNKQQEFSLKPEWLSRDAEIEKYLKQWDDAYNSGRRNDAVKNYEEAVQYLRPHERFSELVADIDHNIRIAKRKLANKQLKKEEKKSEVKNQPSPEAELAKSALGSKASILESLVPIIKSKDPETQKKVSLILETFKASKDEYTRNVGVYLSHLLE